VDTLTLISIDPSVHPEDAPQNFFVTGTSLSGIDGARLEGPRVATALTAVTPPSVVEDTAQNYTVAGTGLSTIDGARLEGPR
jgi:hypothetical protein